MATKVFMALLRCLACLRQRLVNLIGETLWAWTVRVRLSVARLRSLDTLLFQGCIYSLSRRIRRPS